MARATTATRMFGAAMIVMGLAILAVLAAFDSRDLFPQPPAQGFLRRLAILIFVVHILPGSLFVFLAWRMDKLDPWAFIAAMIGATLCLIRPTAGPFAMACCFDLLFRIANVVVIAITLNAFADVRDEMRARRRDRAGVQRGFAPIMRIPASAPAESRPAAAAFDSERRSTSPADRETSAQDPRPSGLGYDGARAPLE